MLLRSVLVVSAAAVAVIACWLVGRMLSLGSETEAERELNGALRRHVSDMGKGKSKGEQ